MRLSMVSRSLSCQFVVDDFFVPHGVDRAIDMRNIVVVETSQNVQYGIGLAYVGKKFIAEAFSLTGTLYQPGYIDDFDRCGDDALRCTNSANLLSRSSGTVITPTLGSMVQKGKFADCALALDKQLKSVDLPTLGRPTIPHCNAILFRFFIF